MSFRTIRHAQSAVWPTVRESLEMHKKSRDATKNNPRATRSAQSRARIPWSRVVANETVWAVAKQGLLASEEAAAVITAAKAWVQDWESQGVVPNLRDGDDKTDIALYEAVQALATADIGVDLDQATEAAGL